MDSRAIVSMDMFLQLPCASSMDMGFDIGAILRAPFRVRIYDPRPLGPTRNQETIAPREAGFWRLSFAAGFRHTALFC